MLTYKQRLCPKCNKVIEYKTVAARDTAYYKKSNCMECSRDGRRKVKPTLSRPCPVCGELIWYTRKDRLRIGTENNTCCQRCVDYPKLGKWDTARRLKWLKSMYDNKRKRKECQENSTSQSECQEAESQPTVTNGHQSSQIESS